MTQVVFDVSAFINSRHVAALQYGITILCGLMMFLDGFDTQAISYMAPPIAKKWGLSREDGEDECRSQALWDCTRS
jgi:MFS transporter, AAHS family, 4-hydroxybenzoate transporter